MQPQVRGPRCSASVALDSPAVKLMIASVFRGYGSRMDRLRRLILAIAAGAIAYVIYKQIDGTLHPNIRSSSWGAIGTNTSRVSVTPELRPFEQGLARPRDSGPRRGAD